MKRPTCGDDLSDSPGPCSCGRYGGGGVAEKPPYTGMRVSLPGVLMRASGACEAHDDSQHLSCSLEMLLDHLRELRADRTQLDRFFDIWSDERKDAT